MPPLRAPGRAPLAAATANIGVATGALYPNISIGAQIGTISLVENLGKPSTNRWGFGLQVSWTILTNITRARSREAEASTQGALAHFDGVLLNAIRETRLAWRSTAHCWSDARR